MIQTPSTVKGHEMRIALVAPLAEAVPPKLYGGTAGRVVVGGRTGSARAQCHLIRQRRVADGGKLSRLRAAKPQTCGDPRSSWQYIADVAGGAPARRLFDIIHFHVDLLPQALFHNLARKCLTTLHGRLDQPDILPLYEAYPEMPLVSISNAQRLPMPPKANWLATIPHGLPSQVCPFDSEGGDYLAFLGRISSEKRPDRAIEIAKRSGIPLKIAAKVDDADRVYFTDEILPLLKHPLIEFLGEIDENRKCEFLGKARALLFPIDWPEPFGLVMIEAMSAGTPVIAWRKGSVAEVITDHVSGMIVDSMFDAVAAVPQTATMSRAAVRAAFEARFIVERMA
jgi:glycosyltransferase involved in cell wall biosynthesis